jgi:hypothetical protein
MLGAPPSGMGMKPQPAPQQGGVAGNATTAVLASFEHIWASPPLQPTVVVHPQPSQPQQHQGQQQPPMQWMTTQPSQPQFQQPQHQQQSWQFGYQQQQQPQPHFFQPR